MLFDDVIYSRRSIREYIERDVSDELVLQIIETARLSPSSKNSQPWKFIVMRGKNKDILAAELQKAGKSIHDSGALETASIMKKAPVLIAVYATSTDRSNILSIGAAIYGMCLKATDLGIGSLWIADTDYINNDKYRNLVGAVCLGYYEKYPEQRSRKPLHEISNISPSLSKENKVTDNSPNNIREKNYAFVSYSHDDKNVVTSDIVELKKHGLPLWYDQSLYSEKGKKWDKVALDRIADKKCTVFIFYISYSSLSSASVLKEFLVASKRKQNGELSILPVLIGNTEISSLIKQLRKNGLRKNAKIYGKYFGLGDSTLYVQRNINPCVLSHVEEVLDYCKDEKIIPDISIYDQFMYRIEENRSIITGYCGFNSEIEIPQTISGYPVEEIAESAFADNRVIEVVHISRTVKKLGLAAFRNSTLKHIDIPNSVLQIDTACFRDCVNMDHIDLPNSIKFLSEALFRGCTALTEVVVPEGVEELGEAVFLFCDSLKKIALPSTLKRMRYDAIIECPALEALIIPADVEGVKATSFENCPKLKPVRIGKFVFSYGKSKYAD